MEGAKDFSKSTVKSQLFLDLPAELRQLCLTRVFQDHDPWRVFDGYSKPDESIDCRLDGIDAPAHDSSEFEESRLALDNALLGPDMDQVIYGRGNWIFTLDYDWRDDDDAVTGTVMGTVHGPAGARFAKIRKATVKISRHLEDWPVRDRRRRHDPNDDPNDDPSNDDPNDDHDNAAAAFDFWNEEASLMAAALFRLLSALPSLVQLTVNVAISTDPDDDPDDDDDNDDDDAEARRHATAADEIRRHLGDVVGWAELQHLRAARVNVELTALSGVSPLPRDFFTWT